MIHRLVAFLAMRMTSKEALIFLAIGELQRTKEHVTVRDLEDALPIWSWRGGSAYQLIKGLKASDLITHDTKTSPAVVALTKDGKAILREAFQEAKSHAVA